VTDAVGFWLTSSLCPCLIMAKTSGLFVVAAGAAILCTAYMLHSRTEMDHRIESKQVDILKGPGSRTDTVLAVAPEGLRAYLRATLVEPTEELVAPVVVTIAKRNNAPSVNASTVAARSATPATGDRTSLVRELQQELRRVGCYDGALNESWTPATRTAMKTFTNRINANLPIDKPDQILLTLVQGYRDRVCGVACPPGEGLAKDGRCLPNAILTLAAKKVPKNSGTLAAEEQPRGLLTPVWSTVTPAHPAIRDLANGQMAQAVPPADQANMPRVVATPAAKTVRVRTIASRRHSNFARTFLGLFGW
jgi:hypothetical protein